ncbi:hypothetical protein QTO34_017358 [Cnephaeus nilssonii]|uniref:Uncharacterized protein n=1 Tax=Cnephaeus nilssonii TaxID=3371016 RepID=A0AA40I0V9_CNENI|nr:hypothetical protein QTO34_017358 [Eptesicus nilssonii]
MLALTVGTNTRWEIKMYILDRLITLDFSKMVMPNHLRSILLMNWITYCCQLRAGINLSAGIH